jgi:MFS-type transporter involved in bile tolerance (Atg22 family)
MASQDLAASSYSFYIVAERFATFVGPALWSITLVVMGEGAVGYKSALLVMAVLIIISLIVIRKIKTPVYS